MERRGHDLSHLPPKIRSYSVRILLIGFAAVALLVGGRKFFSNLADWVWQEIRALLAVAIQLIASLIPENNTTTPRISLARSDAAVPGTASSNDTIFPLSNGRPSLYRLFSFLCKTIISIFTGKDTGSVPPYPPMALPPYCRQAVNVPGK